MDTLVLEGGLGERHKIFNSTLRKLCREETSFDDYKDYQPQNDIDRLMKIEIGNQFKAADYIIDVLKSDDDLLKNKAMKCVWLFNGIDTEMSKLSYMKDNLLPFVSLSTKYKIVHNLSMNLKNEHYAEEYFEYFLSVDDYQRAVKFLPACSVSFIKLALQQKQLTLSETQIIKIAEKNTDLVYEYFKDRDKQHLLKKQYGKVPSLLAVSDTEQFLNWYENTLFPAAITISLGARATLKLLKSYKSRIIDNFIMYDNILNKQSVASTLNLDDINKILLQILSRYNSKNIWEAYLQFLLYTKKFNNIQRFKLFSNIYRSLFEEDLPMDNSLFMEQWEGVLDLGTIQDWAMYKINNKIPFRGHDSLFMWYSFVDFEIAFPRLKSLVKIESDAEKRIKILDVMISSCHRHKREEDLEQLLIYFLKNHSNETNSVSFIYSLIEKFEIYKYGDAVWVKAQVLLNRYICDKGHTKCLDEVIKRYLFKGTPVPENILETVTESTLYSMRDKSKDVDFEEKYFTTLLNAMDTKFNKLTMNETNDKENIVDAMIFSIMCWNKKHVDRKISISRYSSIMNFLIEDRQFVTNVFQYYIKTDKGLYRRFTDVLLTKDSEEKTILYCLKHNHCLLNVPNKEILENITNTWKIHRNFYKKLRIYFAEDLSKFWINYYLEKLKDPDRRDLLLRKSVASLSILLEKDKYTNLIQPYTPKDATIKWSEIDKCVLDRSKHIANFCHFIRPSVSPETMLLFAKGDYLQYVLGSITCASYQYSPEKANYLTNRLINNPVSVQKHGIKLMTYLLDDDTLITKLLREIWSNNKNVSIRFFILKKLLSLLSKTNQKRNIQNYFKFLEFMASELRRENDNKLFALLANYPVKLQINLFSDYCECSWRALVKHGENGYQMKLLREMLNQQKNLNNFFVNGVVKYLVDYCTTGEHIFEKECISEYEVDMLNFIARYLLSAEDDSLQIERISNGFDALVKKIKLKNKDGENRTRIVKRYFDFVNNILVESFADDCSFINSTKLFGHILENMRMFISNFDNIKTIAFIKLISLHHDLFLSIKGEEKNRHKDEYLTISLFNRICEKWQEFGKKSGIIINDLIPSDFPHIYNLIHIIFKQFCHKFINYRCFENKTPSALVLLSMVKGLLSTGNINSILLGLQLLPTKIEGNFSETLYFQIIEDIKTDKRPQVMIFLQAHLSTSEVIKSITYSKVVSLNWSYTEGNLMLNGNEFMIT